MEKKINIAELLKDCPSGIELDCLMYENLFLNKVEEDCRYPIGCYTIYDGCRISVNLTEFGEFNNHGTAKCVIFPKGKTTWEGFVPPCPFNDGDILYTHSDDADSEPYEYIFIFESITENTHVNSYLHMRGDDLRTSKAWLTNCDDKYLRFATEEEKQKLFDAIKDNWYKWNAETKTLEKLPKFKVGDIVQDKDNYKVRIFDVSIEDKCYGYESLAVNGIGGISFDRQDDWELVPNKFDINTLKPFDKVLVRLTNESLWLPKFFSHYDTNSKLKSYPFVITDHIGYPQCIPYNGNEHLCRKTDDCNNFYKTWE